MLSVKDAEIENASGPPICHKHSPGVPSASGSISKTGAKSATTPESTTKMSRSIPNSFGGNPPNLYQLVAYLPVTSGVRDEACEACGGVDAAPILSQS
jgi:hypothetical protein